MKIVQINAVYNIGSTGRTTAEMHEALQKAGHESFVVYSQTNVNGVENTYHMGSPLDIKIHGFLSRLSGQQGYFSVGSTRKLLKLLDHIKPDVVHLRNLHGNYVNLPMLLKYLAKKDIATVITLHDFWFITGKCVHYITEKCDKWQSQCDNCPNINNGNPSWFFDRTKKMHKDKKELFGNIPRLAITGVSKWVTDEAKKSPISKNAVTQGIYNWIDFDKFYPRDVENLKTENGLNDKFTILGVASGWVARKGLDSFISLAKQKKDYNFILVGNMPTNVSLPENMTAVGSLSSVDALAEYYSLADVFVTFSTAETFGKVSAEAMACGTPVVCHNQTACPEILGENCGYSVDVNDIQAVADAIDKVYKNKKSFYSENCIKHARATFEKSTLINEYIDLYSKLCEDR